MASSLTRWLLEISRKMCNFSACGSLVLFLTMLAWSWQSCHGDGTIGFDIHHRLSDPVKAMFSTSNDFPEKGTMGYYTAMVHRDRFHGRRLADGTSDRTPLTFVSGNDTFRIADLGFLYYANVSVGTPESWYLVALDTGSGLFWLPCDCTPNCAQSYQYSATETLQFNIYSPSNSSTGTQLSCTSPLCDFGCLPPQRHCPYRVDYLSANTSSSGYVVEDLLHLTTDTGPSKVTDVKIPFGCGVIQTGHFLETGAPNGLFGLAMDSISLPSVLAREKLLSNSFSMCFSHDGIGRISFGDKGSNHEGETPVIPNRLKVYVVSVTHITVGTNTSTAEFDAIFDTGTSFTLLTEPAYSLLSENFDSQVQDKRVEVDPRSAFQFCYRMNSSPSDLLVPSVNMTMGGGDQFTVLHPWITVAVEDGTYFYCLAVVKSDHDINIIGENFMTGHRIVFDNEKPAVAWKESDCGDAVPFVPSSPTPGYSLGRSAASSSLLHSYTAIAIFVVQVLLFMY